MDACALPIHIIRIEILILGCVNYDYNPMDGLAEGLFGHQNGEVAVDNILDCQHRCDRKFDCGSVAYCPAIKDGQTNCFLYAKILSGSEQIDESSIACLGITSYYKHCTSTGKSIKS